MKELEFIEIIKHTLAKSTYIGDDCAYLKDIGVVITQDSLVEDIHFSLKYTNSYNLGYKAIVVNLSDIFASGAIPKYVTIALSLPQNTETTFIKDFYTAVNNLSVEYGFEVIGGDITGGEKVFISICAIGLTNDRKISSRSNAQIGDIVITTGSHGSSAAGLWMLQNQKSHSKVISDTLNLSDFTNAHLKPTPKKQFSEALSTRINREYAMMDTSDGLVDALFKIAQASNVSISVDFNKIPYDENIKEIAKLSDKDYKDWVLFGGEDYQMVACINEKDLSKIESINYKIIGKVEEKNDSHFVEIKNGDSSILIKNLEQTFNHFN